MSDVWDNKTDADLQKALKATGDYATIQIGFAKQEIEARKNRAILERDYTAKQIADFEEILAAQEKFQKQTCTNNHCQKY